VEKDSADLVRVTLNMGAGNLRVGTGTDKLMRADFDYNVPAWKPEVKYSAGNLSITQPSSHNGHFGNTKYEWDVRLNRDVPINMNVHFGAGEAHLDLGSMALRHVEVNMGVGKIDMDLRGNPKHDYDVNIHGGVGEATVRVPSDVAVVANAHGGIGDISATGMRKEDSRYYNDAYGKAKVTIHLNVEGGVGSIKLISE
jgi:predicted membrane protein